MNSSQISLDHPIVLKAKAMGREVYGSPTLSDQALIPFIQGNAALEAVHGTDYEVGCIPCVLYTASGTTVDYGYAVVSRLVEFSLAKNTTGS